MNLEYMASGGGATELYVMFQEIHSLRGMKKVSATIWDRSCFIEGSRRPYGGNNNLVQNQ